MSAVEFLKWMRDEKRVPWSRENKPPEGEKPSNSELHRWIRNGSVRINGGYVLTLEDTLEAEDVWMIEFFRKQALVTMPGFGA